MSLAFIDAATALPPALDPEAPAAAGPEVLVPNDFDIEALEPLLAGLKVIALHFPKWVDGRAYSQARLLRSRYGFAGEIRAVGEVLVDMLPLMQRTGFSQAQLRADQKRAAAERALGFFPSHYQGDVVEHRPLFARAPE